MAIEFDAAAASAAKSGTGTLTWAHVVGAGANRLLVVGMATQCTAAQPSTVSGVTYNGTAMTLAKATTKASATYSVESSVWILANPASGSHDVVATIALANMFPVSGGVSSSYTGASQTSAADAVGEASGTLDGGSQSFTVTTSADNCWIFAVGVVRKASGVSIAANQTSRGAVLIGSPYTDSEGEDTNAAQTPAGAKTVGFTLSAASNAVWAMTGASFAPAVDAPTGNPHYAYAQQ